MEVGQSRKIQTNNDLVISVDDLTVWTPEEKPWYRKKPTKPKLAILKDVTCHIKGGEFVAVIGPSGAGKTTFLICVAGKNKQLLSSGTVTINTINVTDLPKGYIEVVPQSEAFMESLTVAEHLRFMTEMKLGSHRQAENRAVLEGMTREFKLEKHQLTTISALSGGERRLLSLASSLLSCPRVIICDEPTTGLDSYNALLVVGVLQRLSAAGKTVICSIHQPSSILFKEFNSIMLMAEGRMLFHGSQNDCKELFESINLRCPKNYNPAEFYIKAISVEPSTCTSHVDEISDAYRNRLSDFESSLEAAALPVDVTFQVSQRNWFVQVGLLIWRSSLALKRELMLHLYQLAIAMMISGVIIGTCYVGVSGTTQKGVQDIQGFLWLLTSEIAYGLAYNVLFAFDGDIVLFRREVGLYSGSAFFVARLLCFLPRCVIWPIVFVNIATIAVELPNHALTTLKIIGALIYSAVGATAYGLGMGALFSSTKLSGEYMSCVDLPLFLVSGSFLRLSSIPLWMYSIKYISHFFYSLDFISNIYWRQIHAIDCPSNSTTTCIADGETFLRQSGYSSDFLLVDGIGLLAVIVGWSLVGFYGLKREERKGYAY